MHGRERAARSRTVFDHNGLTEMLFGGAGKRAHLDVCRPTGRPRHDEDAGHRLVCSTNGATDNSQGWRLCATPGKQHPHAAESEPQRGDGFDRPVGALNRLIVIANYQGFRKASTPGY